jgi:hypothetical protein
MTEPLTSDGRVATRGAVQRRAEELIAQGLSNRAAAEICRVELGGRTTPACIAWYRSRLRKVAGTHWRRDGAPEVARSRNLPRYVAWLRALLGMSRERRLQVCKSK